MFDVAISPTARMGSLPVGLRQIVEIVKAARTGAQVVMLDEPTSAISEREVEGLYGIVRRLRDHGVAMVYTTHKMAEIRAIADRVVVLRDGGLILDEPLAEVIRRRHRHRDDRPRTRRTVPRSRRSRRPTPCSRSATCRSTAPPSRCRSRCSSGEIVGLAGLVGAGRTELLEAIFGARHTTSGEILVRGSSVKRNSARRGDHRGHGDGARGPQDLRCRAVDERARQRLAAAAVVVQRRRLAARQGAHQGRLRRDEVGAAAQQRTGPARRHAVRRQPAEGRAGPVADRRRQRPAARRAHPRRRRRRPQRDLPHHHRIRRGRAWPW